MLERVNRKSMIAAIIIACSLLLMAGIWGVLQISQLSQELESMRDTLQPDTGEEKGVTTSAESDLVKVTAAPVLSRSYQESIDFDGVTEPNRQTIVVPKVSGQVEEILVEEGERVERGDLLFKIDSERMEEQYKQARAGLSVAEAQLEMARAGARKEEIKQLEERVNQAEAQALLAKRSYERMKHLYENDVVSLHEYEGTEAEYRVAEAELSLAKRELETARGGAREEEIQMAQAEVELATADLSMAEMGYRDTSIEAPSTGTIFRKEIETGELVGEEPVMVIIDLDQIKVSFQVGEMDVVHLERDQRALVTVDALPEREFEGQVSYVSPAADPESGQFEVEVTVENPDHQLKPGMYARAEVFTAEEDDVRLLPEDIIREDENVYVVVGNLLQKRSLDYSLTDCGSWMVISTTTQYGIY